MVMKLDFRMKETLYSFLCPTLVRWNNKHRGFVL